MSCSTLPTWTPRKLPYLKRIAVRASTFNLFTANNRKVSEYFTLIACQYVYDYTTTKISPNSVLTIDSLSSHRLKSSSRPNASQSKTELNRRRQAALSSLKERDRSVATAAGGDCNHVVFFVIGFLSSSFNSSSTDHVLIGPGPSAHRPIGKIWEANPAETPHQTFLANIIDLSTRRFISQNRFQTA